MSADTYRDQKRESESLDLELQTVSPQGTEELRTSIRAARSLNHLAISCIPSYIFFKD